MLRPNSSASAPQCTSIGPAKRSAKISLLAASLFLALTCRLAALNLYVSPSGNDANSGSINAPFATLTEAQAAIRAVKASGGLPAGGINVWLRAGYYNLTSTFALTSPDSGAAGSEIVYSAYPGEQVHITGATTLNSSTFTLVNNSSPIWARLDPTAQGNVYSASLAAVGINNYGTLKAGGFGLSVVAPLELFFNGQPMTLGRWPNVGQPMVTTVSSPSSTQITYSGTRPQRWTQAQDVWLHGLWNTTWADYQLDVASIDTATNTINLKSVPGQFGIGANQPFYAYNLLEEITQPGEYYVDRSAGIVYFWPPGPLAGSVLQVSMMEGCLVQLTGTSYLTLNNLILEASRGPLLQITLGNNNSAVGCLFRNCGQYGVMVTGTSNGIDQCEIADCGEDGAMVGGGTRSSLTSGNNYVTNSRIHRVGRISWAYHPAINFLDGCGNTAANNLIDELPHAAVLIVGNNYTVESNEISRVCQLTADSGAIYSGRDWGYRGNLISNNYIHDIANSPEGSNTHGVFLDDLMSSAQVTGNVFYNISGAAIACGAGRDNIMTNNIIAQCGIGHFNGDYSRSSVNNTPGSSFNLLARLAEDGIQYQSGVWAAAYPSCAAIPNSWATVQQGLWLNPQGCVFSNNAGWSNASWMTESDVSGTGIFAVYAAITNNNSSQAALFGEAQEWDRSQRPASLSAAVSGFTPIAFGAIGPSLASASEVVLSPPIPVLQNLTLTNSDAELQWSDDGIHTEQQETGFELQRQNAPSGAWQVIQTFGPDVDFADATGLAAATNYAFRIRSFNAVGSVYSNVVTLQTLAPALVLGTSTDVQAATPLTVINDVKKNGTIGVLPPTQQAAASVKLYDAGDMIQASFTTGSGLYSVGVRVRSGNSIYPTYYWPSGYQFSLDGNSLVMVGDPTTVSPYDSGYGGCYWGTMASVPMTMTAGTHVLQITANASWDVVDYVAVTPLVLPQVTTFAQWQQAHFAVDQLANPAISGWNATPAGDSFLNMMKYALAMDPWTAATGTGVQVALSSGEPQLTYSAPSGLTDVSYYVEVSNDTNTWSALPQTIVGQSNGVNTVQATESGAAEQYIRLRVVCTTWTASTGPISTGVATVYGAGNPLTVVSDVGKNGTVGVSTGAFDSWQSVRLYDVGDAISVSVPTGAGSYIIGVRVRSGDASGSMSYWQYGGYKFTLDGSPLAMTGSPGTVSALDLSFGPTYWGTMYSAPVQLTQRTHTIVITSERSWGLAVSVSAAPQQ